MTVAGGSAGHALAMIYACRDGKDAPVPVVFTFGAVGPSCFVAEDWGVFGVGLDNEESRAAGAVLFSVMSGKEITPGEMAAVPICQRFALSLLRIMWRRIPYQP